jgi:hypothetical protein
MQAVSQPLTMNELPGRPGANYSQMLAPAGISGDTRNTLSGLASENIVRL